MNIALPSAQTAAARRPRRRSRRAQTHVHDRPVGLWQARARVPLLPTSVVRDRQRVGAFLTVLFVTIGMFGVFLFLTYYFQRVLGYAPPKTGLAHLPITVGMITGSTQVAARLLNTIAASVTTRYATAHAGPGTDRRALASHAAVHGFNVATWWAMGSLPPAALIAGVVVDAHRVPTPEGRPAPVPEPVESVG